MAHEKPFEERTKIFDPQKQAIDWAAAQLVQDGDCVILDAGTTTRQIAHHRVTRTRLTVVTNNLPIAQDLATCPQINTILLAGGVEAP